jgi:predicted dehydrogenase
MKNTRLGIIGLGNMGKHHAEYLLRGDISRCTLNAVCSINPAELERYPTVEQFSDPEQMIESGLVDAIIIATPHFQHATLGIAAIEAGIHVMVEKPIAAHKADAERLAAKHREHPDVVFAGMFQLRTEPRYLKMQAIIDSGQLGDITRVNWINTDWYRTELYYASGGWRGTWKGEGGGVLLNQCLHNLDTLQWLCGMPSRVHGFCQFGRFHHIDVEDNVTAYFEWGNGATGVFIGSTGETPGTNSLEITGTRGKLVLENERLVFTRNDCDMVEFGKIATKGFQKPESTEIVIPFENSPTPHATMVQNFVDHILDGDPLIAPGEQGINSVELANVIVHSTLLGRPVDLPMNGLAWENQLNRLIAESTIDKAVATVAADDFVSSFRK